MPLAEALRNIHFPSNINSLRNAQLRLKFDELFYIQLKMLRSANQRSRSLQGIVFTIVGDYFNTFYKEYLPFELTNAQKRVARGEYLWHLFNEEKVYRVLMPIPFTELSFFPEMKQNPGYF